MDGAGAQSMVILPTAALDRLMPMHLCLDSDGRITSCGPTLAKLFPGASPLGQDFFALFEVRRPGGITMAADLARRVGERLHLSFPGEPGTGFRGIVLALAAGRGLILNLSFGIAVLDAVRSHALTDADFAPTDLTVELLYLVEAKSAVMDELKQLNLRLQSAKAQAEEQAQTDTLTGLGNRRALDRILAQVIGGGGDFGVMHVDLDHFKAVNDTFGHAAGDHVLREVGRILTEETRTGDTVARVGGDEFVVVLPGLASAARLSGIALRIIGRIGQAMDFDGRTVQVSASIGMTLSRHFDGLSAERLLGEADQALYASKHAGRGQALFVDGDRRAGGS